MSYKVNEVVSVYSSQGKDLINKSIGFDTESKPEPVKRKSKVDIKEIDD